MLVSAVLGANCSQSYEPNTRDVVVKDLVQQDLLELASIPDAAGRSYDARNSQIFSQIFGGQSGAAVNDYFHQRIHYILGPNDLVSIDPQRFQNTSWERGRRDGIIQSDFFRAQESPGRENVQIGASNLGIDLWMNSLINQVPVSIGFGNGIRVEVTSSRVGIMLLGNGYKQTEVFSNGTSVDLPTAYRQSILLHEARHSDCTGGINDDALDIARNARSLQDFTADYPALSCGHLHVICPSGDYAGLPACDKEPWGAYTVGAVFSAAMISQQSSEVDRSIVQAMATDSFSRRLVRSRGKPDMSSAGYQAGS